MNSEHPDLSKSRDNMSILICTSPKAGSGAGREGIAHLVAALQQRGIAVEVTTNINHVRQRTQPPVPSDRCPLVVTAGGDGTLALVAQNTPPATVLVPMPLGTENLLSKHFGFTANIQSLVATLMHGRDHAIDAGLANGKLFLVMATCGFDAEVVRAVHLRRRGHISRFSYLRPIMRTLQHYSFPQIDVRWEANGSSEIDQAAEQSCRWAMVFNVPRYAASLAIEPDADEADGQLNFCGLQRGSILSGMRYLGGIITGRHLHWSDVTRHNISNCRITSASRVSYQLDGDYAGRLPLEIRVLPNYITLRLPST